MYAETAEAHGTRTTRTSGFEKHTWNEPHFSVRRGLLGLFLATLWYRCGSSSSTSTCTAQHHSLLSAATCNAMRTLRTHATFTHRSHAAQPMRRWQGLQANSMPDQAAAHLASQLDKGRGLVAPDSMGSLGRLDFLYVAPLPPRASRPMPMLIVVKGPSLNWIGTCTRQT